MKLLTLLAGVLLCASGSAQIAVEGTYTSLTLANFAPAAYVDPALTITSGTSIPSFRVKITNYNLGDVLDVNATLPGGFTSGFNTVTGVFTITGVGSAADYQGVLRAVRFRTTSLIATSRVITFEAGDGSVLPYGGHYYKLVSGSFSFTTAKANAAATSLFGCQGYLPTISSLGENDFLFNSIGKGWIGASDEFSQINTATGSTTYVNQAASEGKWYWVTGPEKGIQFSNVAVAVTGKYANWATGEPNNANSTEHYAETSNPNNGQWNDASTSGSLNYLVEYGGIESGLTLDLSHSRTISMVATQLNTTTTSLPYSLHATAVAVDPGLIGYSISNFTDGRVTISGNFKTGDALSYTGTLPGTFTGTFNSTTGVLSFATTTASSITDWQNLFRTVKFQSTSNIVGDRTITFSVGNQVAFTNGHFYEYVSSGTTWDNAKTAAEAKTYLGLQGYLATISSSLENEFIRQKMNADAWTGASDGYSAINTALGTTTYANQAASEGKWYWVTGPEKGTQMTTGNAPSSTTYPPVFGSVYNNWNAGEPNNSSSNENAGTIYASGSTAGKWNDLNNTSTLGYVVEYGGTTSDPLMQLSSNRVVEINTVLPVSGLVFEAKRVNENAEISWSTQAETNTNRFELLHSDDGSHYTVLTSVRAAVSSSTEQRYQWTHVKPAAGVHYYKLRELDQDGAAHYSETRMVAFNINTRYSLAPSIVLSEFSITGPTGFKGDLRVMNTAGAEVIHQAISQLSGVIIADHLPAGLYFVEISDKQGRQVLRFVKQ